MKKWVYKIGMFVDRLAEMRRNVGQRFEQARLGVDYFYRENIGSMRWKPFIIVACVSGVGASVISWSMGSNTELQKRVILSLISGATYAGITLLAAVNLNREVHRYASAVRKGLPRGS